MFDQLFDTFIISTRTSQVFQIIFKLQHFYIVRFPVRYVLCHCVYKLYFPCGKQLLWALFFYWTPNILMVFCSNGKAPSHSRNGNGYIAISSLEIIHIAFIVSKIFYCNTFSSGL
uniref:Uncharacterized protein n=1 Tax=Cacopsylla melanoneura TaxID=428564 RepID=A0A8D8QWB6_9HEMI